MVKGEGLYMFSLAAITTWRLAILTGDPEECRGSGVTPVTVLDRVEDAETGASQRAPVVLPQAGLVREPAPGLFPHRARSPDHHLRPQRAQPLPA